MENRRKHKRIVRTFMSWLNFGYANAAYPKGWDMVTIRDIGAGGILFNYDKPIDVGTQIILKIVFPFKDFPIKCVGSVVRNEKMDSVKYASIYRVAAEFKSIAGADSQTIDSVANELYM